MYGANNKEPLLSKPQLDNVREQIGRKLQALQGKLNEYERGANITSQSLIQQNIDTMKKLYTELVDLLGQIKNTKQSLSQKQQMKQIEQQVEIETKRYQSAMKKLINQSYILQSNIRNTSHKDSETNESYLVQNSQDQQQLQQIRETEEDNMIRGDAQCDAELLKERQEALNKLEREVIQVNQIMGDTAQIVDDSGQFIQTITDNQDDTKKNVQATNDVMMEANQVQKKNMRKTIFLVIAILIIVGAVIGIIFATKN